MEDKSEEIRQIATWLRNQSVSSSTDPSSVITKADLDSFKRKVCEAISAIADVMES